MLGQDWGCRRKIIGKISINLEMSSDNYVKVDGNQGTLVATWEFTFTATTQNHKIELHSGVLEIRKIV